MTTALKVLRIETDPVDALKWRVVGPNVYEAVPPHELPRPAVWFGPDTLMACIEGAGDLEPLAREIADA